MSIRNFYVLNIFQVSLNFDSNDRNTENTMPDLYFNPLMPGGDKKVTLT